MDNTLHLQLPEDIKIKNFLGHGRRSTVYAADMLGTTVVVKIYKETYVQKYADKYNADIAEFEYSRNKSFFSQDELKKYTAQPIKILKKDEGYSHSFVQEYIHGTDLKTFARKNGYVPDSVLEAGEKILYLAKKINMHDLDISPGNIKIRQVEKLWLPVIYDFNLMPQHLFPPNPIMALAFFTGLRNKSHRDNKSVRSWSFLAKEAKNLQMQK